MLGASPNEARFIRFRAMPTSPYGEGYRDPRPPEDVMLIPAASCLLAAASFLYEKHRISGVQGSSAGAALPSASAPAACGSRTPPTLHTAAEHSTRARST